MKIKYWIILMVIVSLISIKLTVLYFDHAPRLYYSPKMNILRMSKNSISLKSIYFEKQDSLGGSNEVKTNKISQGCYSLENHEFVNCPVILTFECAEIDENIEFYYAYVSSTAWKKDTTISVCKSPPH